MNLRLRYGAFGILYAGMSSRTTSAVRTRPLRILQVISSSATSGAERHAFTLSIMLRGLGHEVEMVCPTHGWIAQQLPQHGIKVHPIEMKGKQTVAAHLYMLRLVRRNRYDVIHSHLTRATYLGFVSGKLRRVPLVSSVHIANHDNIYRIAARGNNRLVAVSNYVRGVLHGRGVPEKYIDVVYNGTDFHDFTFQSPDGVHEEFQIPKEKRLVGLVGRVCPEKGHLFAARALQDVVRAEPEAHMLFVGRFADGFEPEMRQAITDYGIEKNVTFTGNRNDVSRMFDAMEFSIMPSLIEACPLAALESMARSKALVAARVGGLAELVEHQHNGLLVEQNADELADGMLYMLQNDEDRERMGSNGRRLIEEKFTLHQMVERLEAVYHRTIGTQGLSVQGPS